MGFQLGKRGELDSFWLVKYRKTILTLRQFVMHTKKMQNVVEKSEADYFLMNDLKIIQNSVLSSKLSLLSSSSSFCYNLLNLPPTNHLLAFKLPIAVLLFSQSAFSAPCVYSSQPPPKVQANLFHRSDISFSCAPWLHFSKKRH